MTRILPKLALFSSLAVLIIPSDALAGRGGGYGGRSYGGESRGGGRSYGGGEGRSSGGESRGYGGESGGMGHSPSFSQPHSQEGGSSGSGHNPYSGSGGSGGRGSTSSNPYSGSANKNQSGSQSGTHSNAASAAAGAGAANKNQSTTQNGEHSNAASAAVGAGAANKNQSTTQDGEHSNAASAAAGAGASNRNQSKDQSGNYPNAGAAAAGAGVANRNQSGNEAGNYPNAGAAAAGAGYANRNNGNQNSYPNAGAAAAGAGYANRNNGYGNGYGLGSWNGNYGGFGTGLGNWGGVGAWGVGSSLYGYGYSYYNNPYYGGNGGGAGVASAPSYDYSQPINTASAAPAQTATDQAAATFDQARASFRSNDYATALQLGQQALGQTPNDATIHQFVALAQFAQGNYQQAAGSLYAVLSAGPGWDWTTLIGNYADANLYTEQVRSLEAYVRTNPRSAPARFVLAYEYICQGHKEPAADQLKAAIRLQPTDTLSPQLLAKLQPPSAGDAAAPSPPQPQPFDASKLTGNWVAQGPHDAKISLAIQGDGAFTWGVAVPGKPATSIAGTSTVTGGVLTLAGQDSKTGPLSGLVAWQDDAHFTFKVPGAPATDPGLAFAH